MTDDTDEDDTSIKGAGVGLTDDTHENEGGRGDTTGAGLADDMEDEDTKIKEVERTRQGLG